MLPTKPKLSIYWAAGCGGCEIAVANLGEKLLAVDAAFELAFSPCFVDTKKREVEAMADGELALTLFNGAIRTTEDVKMARLLRRTSKVLVAFGSCAYEGCIPGLGNLTTRADTLATVYCDGPGLDNPDRVVPAARTVVPEGVLELPELLDRVQTLADVVDVDYVIPGCPPEVHQIWAVLDAVIQGAPLPPPGPASVLGAGESTVCRDCRRTRSDKKVERFVRRWEIVPDPDVCLVEQGLVCMGLATRDGCGALCPQVGMPCIGCYGPPAGVADQGAKMAAALGSMIDIDPLKELGDDELRERVDEVLAAVPDWAGTFYKFSLPASLLGAAMRSTPEGERP